MKKSVAQMRQIGHIEGISFLLLLGVAMPLKYFAGMPMAVKIVGWAHGVLFVAFCFAILRVMLDAKWSIFRAGMIFVSGLIPFGPFLADRWIHAWEKESTGGANSSAGSPA